MSVYLIFPIIFKYNNLCYHRIITVLFYPNIARPYVGQQYSYSRLTLYSVCQLCMIHNGHISISALH